MCDARGAGLPGRLAGGAEWACHNVGMAIAKPELSVVDALREQAGRNPRTRAMDTEFLRVVDALQDADFDQVAAQVGHNAALRDGLAGWLVSARSRGLVEPLAASGARQRFAVTRLGHERLIAGD